MHASKVGDAQTNFLFGRNCKHERHVYIVGLALRIRIKALYFPTETACYKAIQSGELKASRQAGPINAGFLLSTE